MFYKLKEHLYYSKDKLFETPGFWRIASQNKLVLFEKFMHVLYNEEFSDS